MKNKFIAALLAFVGGTIGIHKFYLRDYGAGIFYIFLTMMTADFFPVSFILSMIDGMRYLMMPQEEFDRKFNSKYYRDKPTTRTPARKNQREYYEVNRKNTPTPSRKRGVFIKDNPFKSSGIKKYKEYDIEEAILDFEKALKIEPNDLSLYFNLACAHALLENKDDAFGYLDLAVQKGFNELERIMTHDDLAFLRIQPEFDTFKLNGFRRSKEQTAEQFSPEEVPVNDILLAQLNRLMELRKKGVLTEHEFTIERKKILSPR